MPAKKPPDKLLSELLQVRVTPTVKIKINLYILERIKRTGQDYGIGNFLREAIHQKLKRN